MFNIFILIISFITCFFGYKLNKTLIAIIGLFLGFDLGIILLPHIITSETVIYVLSAIIAIILGFIAYKIYLVGVFFLCMISAYVIFGNLGLETTYQTVVSLTVGVIAGIVGVKFTRPLMIISTSLSGALVLTEITFSILNFEIPILNIITSLIIAILGMYYQFKTK